MTDKFNAFNTAKEEAATKNVPMNKMPVVPSTPKKELKKNTTLSIKPSSKKKFKALADSVNMSMSELLEFWIDQQ